MDWLSIALVSAASQSLLLCVLILCLNFGHQTANRFLAIYVGLHTIPLVLLALIYSGVHIYPPLLSIYLLAVLKEPALYLYVRALTDTQFVADRRLFIHLLVLVPGLVLILWNMPEYMDTALGLSDWQAISIVEFRLLAGFIAFGYGLRSLNLLNRHLLWLEQNIAEIEKKSLSWLKSLIVLTLGILACRIAVDMLALITVDSSTPDATLTFVLILSMGVIFLITLGGLRQPIIFTPDLRAVLDRSTASSVKTPKNPANKYEKTRAASKQLEDIWRQLREVMSEQQPYTNDQLSLPDLAERLNITPHLLSQAINVCSGNNFYELINHYRVDAAKQLLSQPQNNHRKMLDIYNEVGFSSQSTFYAHFKKLVGLTPTAYRKTSQSVIPPGASTDD